jgi:hypothetical protein
MPGHLHTLTTHTYTWTHTHMRSHMRERERVTLNFHIPKLPDQGSRRACLPILLHLPYGCHAQLQLLYLLFVPDTVFWSSSFFVGNLLISQASVQRMVFPCGSSCTNKLKCKHTGGRSYHRARTPSGFPVSINLPKHSGKGCARSRCKVIG